MKFLSTVALNHTYETATDRDQMELIIDYDISSTVT